MLPVELLEGFEKKMAEIHQRSACPIEIARLPETYNDIMSLYLRDKHTIIFNEKIYYEASEVQVMSALFHEIRHAYQYHVVQNKLDDCEEFSVIQQWEKDFKYYQQPLEMKSSSGESLFQESYEYLSLSIEIDALAYADLNIYRIYQTHLMMPDLIREAVKERQEIIKNRNDIIKM
jgi:hypothetical protein